MPEPKEPTEVLAPVPAKKGTGKRLFQKGQSGNPGGRPKGYQEFREAARELTPKAMKALEELLEHVEGLLCQVRVAVDRGPQVGPAHPPVRLVEPRHQVAADELGELDSAEPAKLGAEVAGRGDRDRILDPGPGLLDEHQRVLPVRGRGRGGHAASACRARARCRSAERRPALH